MRVPAYPAGGQPGGHACSASYQYDCYAPGVTWQYWDSTGFGVNNSNLAGGLPRIELSAAEKQALIAFLKAGLTDDRVAFERAPFDHPELQLTDGHIGSDTALVLIPAVGQAGRLAPVTPFADLVASGGLGYPVVVNLPPVVTAPPTQSSAVNAPVSLQIAASDPEGGSLTFSANGLPTGLSTNSSSGLISGTARLLAASTPP